MIESGFAARLERSSFLRNEEEQKKREWKAELSAQIKENITQVLNKKNVPLSKDIHYIKIEYLFFSSVVNNFYIDWSSTM